MAKKILTLCFLMVGFACSVFAYDTMELEKDFKEVVKLGDRIYKSSIKASRVMSETLVQDGTPTDTISTSQVATVQQQLTSEDKTPVELQASNIQSSNMNEMMPKPSHVNTEALEKLISGKRRGSAPQQQTSQEAAKLKRNDKNLVAKVFPDHSIIEQILVSTNDVAANPASLDSDSVKFRDKCIEMFNKLGKRGETAARMKFYELLARRENLGVRWYFAGVAAMVAGFPEYEREQAVQKLKTIVPDLQKESKSAVKAIDWDFAVAIETMPNAKKSFVQSLSGKTDMGTIANMTSVSRSSSAKRGWWSGSSSSKDSTKLSVNYWQVTWNHMWGDMADHLQSNFDKGTQYGQQAGEFIGLASGIGEAFGKMAAEKTAYNIVQQVRDYAHDTIIGEMGLKPDPYSIVGHFAGGAIGTIGGVIGNATGWFVGTMESIAAQRSKGSGAARKTQSVKDAETIKMF